jgi:hypothetical protein
MLIRRHFVTNSSSVGYVAWGVIIPKAHFDTMPEYGNGVSVRYVSDTKRMACIEESVTCLDNYSEEENMCVDSGVYPLKETGHGLWEAKCIATASFHVHEPLDKYDEWIKRLAKSLKEAELFDLCTFVPGWKHVRHYD